MVTAEQKINMLKNVGTSQDPDVQKLFAILQELERQGSKHTLRVQVFHLIHHSISVSLLGPEVLVEILADLKKPILPDYLLEMLQNETK